MSCSPGRRGPTIKPRRKQFTLGSMMIVVAICAFVFAFPSFFAVIMVHVTPILFYVAIWSLLFILNNHSGDSADPGPRQES